MAKAQMGYFFLACVQLVQWRPEVYVDLEAANV